MKADIIKKIQSGENKTFCVMPWMSINGEANGDFCLCCYDTVESERGQIGNIKDISISKYWNGEALNKIRKTLLEGKKTRRCTNCYKREELGAKSNRLHINNAFKRDIESFINSTDIETGATTSLPTYLDIRFSNVCNLACRMCWSGYSNSRIEIDKRLHKGWFIPVSNGIWNTPKFFEERLIIHNLKYLYISGGEPFMNPDQFKLIKILVDQGRSHDIHVTYNTNLTVVRDEVLLPLIHYKYITFIFSCDGYREMYEYIRIGGKWDIFLKKYFFMRNFFKKHNYTNIEIVMNTVVQRDNILDIPKIYIYAKKNLKVDRVRLEILVDPEELCIEHIEWEKRSQILSVYEKYIEKYKHTYPQMKEDLSEIMHIIRTKKPVQKYLEEYYRTKKIMDEYAESINIDMK